jgi:hypothetical protein
MKIGLAHANHAPQVLPVTRKSTDEEKCLITDKKDNNEAAEERDGEERVHNDLLRSAVGNSTLP